MSLSGECSVMKEIAKTEEALNGTYERLYDLEDRLRLDKNLPDARRKLIETELEEVRKLLKTNEDQLSHLRTHNRQTFVFVVSLCFICFTVYMLYILIAGRDF